MYNSEQSCKFLFDNYEIHQFSEYDNKNFLYNKKLKYKYIFGRNIELKKKAKDIWEDIKHPLINKDVITDRIKDTNFNRTIAEELCDEVKKKYMELAGKQKGLIDVHGINEIRFVDNEIRKILKKDFINLQQPPSESLDTIKEGNVFKYEKNYVSGYKDLKYEPNVNGNIGKFTSSDLQYYDTKIAD